MTGEAKYVRNLTPVPEALERMKARVSRLTEKMKVPLWEAQGLVLAEPILSPRDIPPLPKSAYDGYALNSSETPGRFRLAGKVTIGSLPGFRLGPGEAAYVTTGSFIPEGADAVVPEENARVEDGCVIVGSKVDKWAYVDPPGAYAKRGSVLLNAGRIITPFDVVGLLDAGVAEAVVYRPLRIGIVSTGNELFPASTPEQVAMRISEGKVVATTGDFVAWFSQAYLPYTTVVDVVTLPDDLEAVSWYIERLLDLADMVLVTGGTGPSEIDLFYRLPARLGGELVFRGLRVIGGKPTSGMVVDGKPVIGLSGYPLSALHGFIRLVYPLTAYMANLRVQPPLPVYKAVLGSKIRVKRARPIKARLVERGGRLVADPLSHELQKSSALVALSYADGLILAEEGEHEPGDEVLVLAYRLPNAYYKPSISF